MGTQSTGDIFGGSQSTVIDLNDVAATPDLARDRKDTVLGQPLVKKRKITIMGDAEKAKYDRRKLAESLAASQPAASRSTCPSSDHSSKKASASDYLKKVKSLEPSKYNAFSQMTRTYRVDKNFDVLLATLKDIFLRGSQMPQLFREYRQFISKEHSSRFDQECQRL